MEGGSRCWSGWGSLLPSRVAITHAAEWKLWTPCRVGIIVRVESGSLMLRMVGVVGAAGGSG